MDTFWEEVISYVKDKSPDGSRFVAPKTFEESLRSIVPYSEIANCDLDEVSGFVIHKGLYEEIDASFLYQILDRTVPTFANKVFIVLEENGTRLPSNNEHLGSLRKIKKWAEMNADPSIKRSVDVEKLIDESGKGDDAILTPMVNFIVDNLVKVIDPTQTKPVIAVAETAERFNDTSWFWVDDTGKTAELFAVPKVRDAHPALADAMLDYVLGLSPDRIIHRRAAVPELKLVSGDPEKFHAFNSFFKLTGDLTKGVICPSIRYNDDRARLIGQYSGNLIRFCYKGRRQAVNVKSAIKKWTIEEYSDRIVFSHSSEIRARPLIGKKTRVCDVICKYTLWRARPTLELSVTVAIAPGVALEEVQLSTAFDKLNPEGGFQTAIVGHGDEFQNHPARIKERVTLRSGPADYLCLYEAGCIPGFAHGLHTRFKDGSKLKDIIAGGNYLKDIVRAPYRWVSSKLNDVSAVKLKAILAEGPSSVNYYWVYARYGLGDLRDGETISIVEDRLLTGGGYYNKPQIYHHLMIAAEAGPGEVDPSVSYDVGAELNAVAVTLLFAKLGLYRISPPSEERLASLKAWFDRHLITYLEVVRAGEAGEQQRVFVRGLSFVILSLDCMARAYQDGGYQTKLQTCVQIMLRLEKPVRGGMEESFFGSPFGPPELDCQVSALLALARAAFWGDPDRRISAAIRRGLRAISPSCAYSDPGGQTALLYDSLLFRKEVGATKRDTGFWNFKCGLALRAFNAVLQMQRLGFLFLDQHTLNHLEILKVIARLALKPSMQWEAGKLEVLTSQKSGETNSETQPWVALGLAPAIEWAILGKPTTAVSLTCRSFTIGSPPESVVYFDQAAPPMHVECDCSGPQAIQMLKRVASAWEGLGESKPHWSVLANDQYLPSNIAYSEQNFFATGQHDRNRLFATIRRVGRDPAAFKVAHEFGCGIGRLTNYLSESFERVIACDVSQPHLELARARSAKIGRTNIDYRLARLPTFGMEDPFDLWFSIIVLQHNPPPIMAMILRRTFSLLRPGGVAVFQIPTYSPNYHFNIDEYLASSVPPLGIEMHFLPQSALFKLVYEAGCSLLEVTHDGTAGAKECLSNLVVITK